MAITLTVDCGALGQAGAPDNWVGTWACGPQLVEPANLPPVPLANSTLRQIVPVTLGGSRLRVRFSNAFGTNPVTLHSVHVALAMRARGNATGEINPATDKALTFHGAPSATIPPGDTLLSDPLDYDLPPLANLAVTIFFGDISATALTGHPGSRTTSFVQPGDWVASVSLPAAARAVHWYVITGIDVLATSGGRAIVILGDSLTDGRGSTTDGSDRWTDELARRLSRNSATVHVAVLNLGIGGNGIFGGLGPSAQARFERDVLGQSGARWVMVFEGLNDLGAGASAQSLMSAYARFVNRAHEKHLLVFGATLPPFGGHAYYTTAHEAARQEVNAWIRQSGKFDAVIDFDAVVRNPVTLTNLLSDYDSGDGLHLNPAGYKAMADSLDLNLFAK